MFSKLQPSGQIRPSRLFIYTLSTDGWKPQQQHAAVAEENRWPQSCKCIHCLTLQHKFANLRTRLIKALQRHLPRAGIGRRPPSVGQDGKLVNLLVTFRRNPLCTCKKGSYYTQKPVAADFPSTCVSNDNDLLPINS